MSQSENLTTKKGLGLGPRRAVAYIVLVFVSILCLFWFYVLFINATRSHGELTTGFTPMPSTHLLENWRNLLTKSTQPIWSGMFNSFIVAALSAILCTYFSTMTAYAIHAYDFKLKKFMFTFILIIIIIKTQENAQGFLQMVYKIKLEN